MAYDGSLGPVDRSEAAKDRKRLAALDANRKAPKAFGKGLALADIHQCPSLFQPRGDSLNYSPGRSAEHITDLKRGLRRGEALEPVTVVSFGPHWHLVDGHHRIEAYRLAKWRKLIPANAETSETKGAARVAWAVDISTAHNRNNKLAMSMRDKSDAAWRRLVAAEGQRGAAAETVRATGVSERTVATMAKTLKTLGELGRPIPETWSAAQREAAEDRDGKTGDYDERRERELLRRLQPVMEHKPSSSELVRALHAYDPALCRDLYVALSTNGWKEGVEEEWDI